MKQHKLIWLLLAVGVMKTSNAQSIGGTAQVGIYAPSYTNLQDAKEQISGTGFMTLGATYEIKFGNEGKQVLPIVLSYSRFGTEQKFGENQVMSNSANSISLGAGYKHFFAGDDNTLRPFVGVLLNYEALVNAKYYYDAQQAGDLAWKSNLYANVQAGVGLETGLNSRIDFYVMANAGLLNRLDKTLYGVYRDHFLGLGVNFVFN
jgi:outer membrane protein W